MRTAPLVPSDRPATPGAIAPVPRLPERPVGGARRRRACRPAGRRAAPPPARARAWPSSAGSAGSWLARDARAARPPRRSRCASPCRAGRCADADDSSVTSDAGQPQQQVVLEADPPARGRADPRLVAGEPHRAWSAASSGAPARRLRRCSSARLPGGAQLPRLVARPRVRPGDQRRERAQLGVERRSARASPCSARRRAPRRRARGGDALGQRGAVAARIVSGSWTCQAGRGLRAAGTRGSRRGATATASPKRDRLDARRADVEPDDDLRGRLAASVTSCSRSSAGSTTAATDVVVGAERRVERAEDAPDRLRAAGPRRAGRTSSARASSTGAPAPAQMADPGGEHPRRRPAARGRRRARRAARAGSRIGSFCEPSAAIWSSRWRIRGFAKRSSSAAR